MEGWLSVKYMIRLLLTVVQHHLSFSYQVVLMLTKESKYSGGCAWDASLIRAPGASVEGNKGSSSGVSWK